MDSTNNGQSNQQKHEQRTKPALKISYTDTRTTFLLLTLSKIDISFGDIEMMVRELLM